MDSCSEIATDILISFAEFYIRMDEIQKSMRVSNELEIIDLPKNIVQLVIKLKTTWQRVKMNDQV